MSKLNIYIDGSWLFKVCAPRGVLAAHMEHDEQAVLLDFTRLDMILLDHATAHNPDCTELGERHICMCALTLPSDFNNWPNQHNGVAYEDIERTKKGVFARNCIIESATDAGYSDASVTRPQIKPWSLDKLTGKSGKYQEKCADTSIAFMLGQSLANSSDDIQCIVTGDADLLPPVVLDNPKHTCNLILATTRPDEVNAEHRQSSFALNSYDFRIPPVYLQDNLLEIVKGEYVSECSRCQRVFSRSYSPPNHLPCCAPCYDYKLYNRQPYPARCV